MAHWYAIHEIYILITLSRYDKKVLRRIISPNSDGRLEKTAQQEAS
jgi:hypothetical protein